MVLSAMVAHVMKLLKVRNVTRLSFVALEKSIEGAHESSNVNVGAAPDQVSIP